MSIVSETLVHPRITVPIICFLLLYVAENATAMIYVYVMNYLYWSFRSVPNNVWYVKIRTQPTFWSNPFYTLAPTTTFYSSIIGLFFIDLFCSLVQYMVKIATIIKCLFHNSYLHSSPFSHHINPSLFLYTSLYVIYAFADKKIDVFLYLFLLWQFLWLLFFFLFSHFMREQAQLNLPYFQVHPTIVVLWECP